MIDGGPSPHDHYQEPSSMSWATTIGAILGSVVIVSAAIGAACIFGVF